MKKFLLWFCVILVGVGCMHSSMKYNVVSKETLVERLEDTTVAFTQKDVDGDEMPYCSGVWITSNKILTAEHCASHPGRFVNNLPSDAEYNSVGDEIEYVVMQDVSKTTDVYPKAGRLGKIVSADRDHDLALVEAYPDFVPHHGIAQFETTETMAPGSEVHIVGHTTGLWWTYVHGYISASRVGQLSPKKLRMDVVQISSPAWSGNSGGGAFTTDGNLIGIASWVSTQAPEISFFIHHDEILHFLKRSRAL